MPELVLGPLLRHVGHTDATVWVEADSPCEVEVVVGDSFHRSRTFRVGDHHYALVHVTDLESSSSYEYAVTLDGEKVWPEPNSPFSPSVIRTMGEGDAVKLVFGSCRISAPHEPPYSLSHEQDERGLGVDALYAMAMRLRKESADELPHALVLLGDQVYAHKPPQDTIEFIRSRRDTSKPPGEEVADFEEYTRLYWDSWKDPTIRWLLSTVPSAMIFDDHDVHDDWNSSAAWVRQMRAKPWWEERIVGAFMSYWVYQHLGNLSPEDLEEDELFGRVQAAEDATRVLREFAYKADREVTGARWSFHRDFGNVRLIMMDSRAGRVLDEEHRTILDAGEWAWIEDKSTGDFDHLLFGTSLPVFLMSAMHHLEAWNEAVCQGAWGRFAARLGESIRQALDLEHWAAFDDSFDGLARLLRDIGAGERTDGRPPASIILLSGDVHHGYLAEIAFKGGAGVESHVYQVVSSPLRNPLGLPERLAFGAAWTKPGELIGKALTRLASVAQPDVGWHLMHEKPWFDNHISTLELRGREATLKVEKTTPEDAGEPRLYPLLERRLA